MFSYDGQRVLHVFFMVGYFAGTFSTLWMIAQLKEAERKFDPDRGIITAQLARMMRRTWLHIAWPSLIGMLLMGVLLIAKNAGLFMEPWMYAKTGLVALLIVHHMVTHGLWSKARAGALQWKSLSVRLWNALAMLLLFALIYVVVRRGELGTLWGVLGGVMLATAVFLLVRKLRGPNKENGASSS